MSKLYYIQIKNHITSETKEIFDGSDGYRKDSFRFLQNKQHGYLVTVDEVMFSFDEEDMKFRECFAAMQNAISGFSSLKCVPKIDFDVPVFKIANTSNSPTKRIVSKVVTENTENFAEDCFFVFEIRGMSTNFQYSRGKNAILHAPIDPDKGKILGHKCDMHKYENDELLKDFHLEVFFSVMD